MADRITPEQRSAIMSRIRSKDTRPEIVVRRALHAMGFRFRLHVRSLPGCPDIVLPKHSIAVQVRGCFWHLHRCMKRQAAEDQRGLLAAEARRQQGTGHRERPQAAAAGMEGQDDLGVRTG